MSITVRARRCITRLRFTICADAHHTQTARCSRLRWLSVSRLPDHGIIGTLRLVRSIARPYLCAMRQRIGLHRSQGRVGSRRTSARAGCHGVRSRAIQPHPALIRLATVSRFPASGATPCVEHGARRLPQPPSDDFARSFPRSHAPVVALSAPQPDQALELVNVRRLREASGGRHAQRQRSGQPASADRRRRTERHTVGLRFDPQTQSRPRGICSGS